MTFLLLLLGICFLLLPFIPTLLEVARKTDAQPLKISTHILRDPRSTPDLLFWHFAQLLGLESLQALKEKISVTTVLPVQSSALAVPGGPLPKLDKKIGRVISAESITLTDRVSYPSKILSMKSVTTGIYSALNEVHAMETLTISKGNRVIWWASGAEVVLDSEVNVPGKIQAKNSLKLNGPARFHLLESPEIIAGDAKHFSLADFHYSESDPVIRTTEDFTLKDNEEVKGSIIAHGSVFLGKNSKVFGSIKAHGEVELSSEAFVYGSVVGLKNAKLEGGNAITGSLLLQQNLEVGPHCQIGTNKHQITCSAQNICFNGPFRVHGLLRAWKSGECKVL